MGKNQESQSNVVTHGLSGVRLMYNYFRNKNPNFSKNINLKKKTSSFLPLFNLTQPSKEQKSKTAPSFMLISK